MRVTVRPEPGITLSHRWGDALRVTLTQLSRAEMLRGIKLTSLPMTFQDAIILARNLGVSYLWIDALCIIQDSKSDWALESAEMSRIYSCSLLTIAASSARDSETEFLYQRVPQPPMLFEDASTFWPPVKGDNLLEVRTTAISPLRNIRNSWMVLQETILSPRTVHFSKEQMFWQCRTCALGEGDVENVEFNYWPSYDFQNNKAFLSNRLPDWTDMQQRSGDGWIQRPEFYSIQTQWLRIVNEYCKRLLTYESDTLPALSGCATSFCSFTKDMYLAGIWLSDLSRGLLLSTEDSKPSRSYQAPSWSW
ncbi:HET-domain-containing protein, partial [Hyaloscypha variabilis F]